MKPVQKTIRPRVPETILFSVTFRYKQVPYDDRYVYIYWERKEIAKLPGRFFFHTVQKEMKKSLLIRIRDFPPDMAAASQEMKTLHKLETFIKKCQAYDKWLEADNDAHPERFR